MKSYKCSNCKQQFERIEDVPNMCPDCIDTYYSLDSSGSWAERETPYVSNKDYKKELQGVTHRGKTKVKK